MRSLLLCGLLGAGYATLVTLEVEPQPVELDGSSVGNNKNQKSSTTTTASTSTQSSNNQQTYTYQLSAPINSQLSISPIP